MLASAQDVTLKSGQRLTLRSPKPEEAGILLEHLKLLFRESCANMNHPPHFWDSFSIEEEAKILSDFASAPTKFMLSAFDGERIVGNLGLFTAPAEYIRHSGRTGMGILREFHGQGLGTHLMNRAKQIARELGLLRLELSVRTYNSAGIALYEKSGFSRVGLLRGAARIDGELRDEYLYELLL